jgi:trk system potassium uptake protein TrkA
MVQGQDLFELSAMVKDEARVFSFVARADDAVAIEALDLPNESRVICLYREEKFRLPEPDTRLHVGDEVIVLTHSRNLPRLQQRWGEKSRRR